MNPRTFSFPGSFSAKFVCTLALSLFAIAPLCAQAQTPQPLQNRPGTQPWKQIAIPTLPAFKPAEPTHITLANGVQIFLEEDHELPFITGFVRIRGGSRDEPADKIGLVSLYGHAWRTSGTATVSGDALDDQLAAKAASIETGGGQASTYISWNSFAKDFDSVFATSLDLLLHPNFQQSKLDLAKRSELTSILRRNDDASGIAQREAVEIAYGATNPYGRIPELATVSAVTLDDLQAWHQRTVCGANLIVGVIGDFNTQDMEAKLRAAFEPIPRGTEMPAPKIDFTEPKPGIYFANKADVDQSNVYMVGLGTEERNPDFYALSVMNEVFSGGFGSRVVQQVRTKLGLAYDVGGEFGAAYDHPGLFAVGLGTKSSSTDAATKATLDEVRLLRTEPPTEAELRRAKDDLLNSFIFNYDSPEKVLGEQVVLAVYGYPSDFLERYRAGIERVTSADVSRVAQKYVQPEKLAIVVVGNQSEIEPPLKDLGPVTPLDIAIPGAPPQQ
ncbi:MAG TPA: pitrilysin family protein [Acidobacteriaceae bacterium]|jgi:zinc protease|nr:pitrilysin family protein [Acidobacteriaceae bacterium]